MNNKTQGNGQNSAFFDSGNIDAKKLREQLSTETLDEVIYWLGLAGSKVAIFDATNTTIARRQNLISHVKASDHKVQVFFIERYYLINSVFAPILSYCRRTLK